MTNPQTKRPTPVKSDLYDQFTKEVGMRYGLREGIIKESLEDAISDWIKKSQSIRSSQANIPVIESTQ